MKILIVTGQRWRSTKVANRLIEIFDLYDLDAVKRKMREERFAPVVNLLRAMGV